jgi:hypothetical protein
MRKEKIFINRAGTSWHALTQQGKIRDEFSVERPG